MIQMAREKHYLAFFSSSNRCFSAAFSINSLSLSSATTLMMVTSSSTVFLRPLLPVFALLYDSVMSQQDTHLSLSVDNDLPVSLALSGVLVTLVLFSLKDKISFLIYKLVNVEKGFLLLRSLCSV